MKKARQKKGKNQYLKRRFMYTFEFLKSKKHLE